MNNLNVGDIVQARFSMRVGIVLAYNEDDRFPSVDVLVFDDSEANETTKKNSKLPERTSWSPSSVELLQRVR